MSLEKAFENLTKALAEYGCEFVKLSIDCPKINVDKLAKTLRDDCACENISCRYQLSPETNCAIICTTTTGFSKKTK